MERQKGRAKTNASPFTKTLNNNLQGPVVDFIDQFVSYTDERPSPEIFRKWSAITTLSGALEKRVWTMTKAGPQFANLYTMLVAPPGVGKSQAINPAEQMLKATKKFKIAPNSVTAASFVDALVNAQRNVILSDNKMLQYHHLFVFAAELGVFLNAHDLNFLSIINELFDHKDSYREERRHSLKEPIDIPRPMTTLLTGSQPGFLGAILPESAWTMGWTSRMLMVYSSTAPDVPLFGEYKNQEKPLAALVKKLDDVADYYGEIKWAANAIAEMERWRKDGWKPVPDHPKLAHYLPRRGTIFAVKLAMVSAMSRGEELAIRLQDVERARGWLLEIEALMPCIFRDMVMRSDDQVMEEVFQYTFEIYLKHRTPIASALILRFLAQRTPAEKAERILSLMEKSGIFERVAGTDNYIPRARNMHGMA